MAVKPPQPLLLADVLASIAMSAGIGGGMGGVASSEAINALSPRSRVAVSNFQTARELTLRRRRWHSWRGARRSLASALLRGLSAPHRRFGAATR